MKVLIVGGGGREHALAWKAAASPRVEQVWVAPGNAGTALEPGVANVEVAADDIAGLLAFARDNHADLTIVGPEAPLVDGIVDRFQAAGLRIFGPTQEGARLEGSKAFTKAFLQRHGIPTAAYGTFTELAEARRFIAAQGTPLVIKADGLAGGKGVVICQSLTEAIDAAEQMLEGDAFGSAGRRIVVEEFLAGEEASFIAMVAGEQILALASSQDHKARDDGDRGPNTGGMGAYSPAPVVSVDLHQRIMREVMQPTVAAMAAEGTPYTGFLYAGVMVTADGTPKVLEFNVRLGDPETQPILMRLQSDLVALCDAALDGHLPEQAEWDPRACLGVVMAADGYPGVTRKGDRLEGLQAELPDTRVFHAATARSGQDVVTHGGRVLCVCALGDSVASAQQLAYRRVETIHWPQAHYRRDIGHRAVLRERPSTPDGR